LSFCTGIIICFAACQKGSNSNPNNGDTGTPIKGFLKQYRLYYPTGISPDSIIVDIAYDTLAHSIILKQDFTGAGPTNWWKYQFDASGYLTSVYDVTPGIVSSQLIDSFTYDANKNLATCLTYENKIIPYTTTLSSTGKLVVMYDTSFSGYLGGSVFGKGTIQYNTQNQVTDRWLDYGENTQTTAAIEDHEIFLYDVSNNIIQYTINESRHYQNSSGVPDSSFSTNSEAYNLRDAGSNELYKFDSVLLKGVINLLGGNALIDPLNNIIGTSKTLYFQSQKSVLLQGDFENGYNFSSQPARDSLGRLTNTSVYDYQMPGVINIYLSYY
jgi:hypothetical protein